MSDCDSEPMTPGLATASIALARSLTGVETRCRHMAALLDTNDLDDIKLVARSAADRLLKGRAAYRRIVECEPAKRPPVEEAWRRLEVAHTLLLDLISRARAVTHEFATQSDLDDTWLKLVTAAAESTTGGAASAELGAAAQVQGEPGDEAI